MRSKTILFLCGLFATTVLAHPHVFVDANIKVLFDEKGLSGVHNHWVYDEIYSKSIIASVDQDNDGKLSPQESENLKPKIFADLVKANYFNYIQCGSNFLPAKGIRTFKASVQNQRLVLDFTVSFSAAISNDYTLLVIVVADPSNYVQVTADMEKADVEAPGTIDVEYFSDSLEGLSLFRAFLSYVEGLYLRYKKK